jgi:hypothetical protein
MQSTRIKLLLTSIFVSITFYSSAQLDKKTGIFSINNDSLNFKLLIVGQSDSSFHFWSFWNSIFLNSGTFYLSENEKDAFYFSSAGKDRFLNSTCIIKGQFLNNSVLINYFDPICFAKKIMMTPIKLRHESTRISNDDLISRVDNGENTFRVKIDAFLSGHEGYTSSNSVGKNIKAGQKIISTFSDHQGNALIYFLDNNGQYIFGWLDSKNLVKIK